MGGLLRSRFEPEGTSETWERWQGRTVGERFPLQTYLGGSHYSAVFLTSMPGVAGDATETAIRLIFAEGSDAEKQLRQWKAAGELKHPNLIRIYEAGRSDLDGAKLIYVVEEYAEENLAQILPDRALATAEAREMLRPVLRALQFLHDRGFVHGRIQPSNILAIGDQVKLSSDSVSLSLEITCSGKAASAYRPPESATGAILAPADVWQLGVMLVEVLTQRLPRFDLHQNKTGVLLEGIPQPFREIVENCLRTEPAKRWTVGQISDCLEGRQPESRGPVAVPAKAPAAMSASMPDAVTRKRSSKWFYTSASIAAVLIVIFLVAQPKPSAPPQDVRSTQVQQSATPESPQPAPSAGQPQPTSTAAVGTTVEGAATPSGAEPGSVAPDENGVVHREIPQISPGARGTLHGTIIVRVRATVDSTGDVTKAKIVSGGPSRYFSRIALQAAQDWKFAPAQAGAEGTDRKWNLQFSFSRKKTEVSAARAKH
jgi:TonB family protein